MSASCTTLIPSRCGTRSIGDARDSNPHPPTPNDPATRMHPYTHGSYRGPSPVAQNGGPSRSAAQTPLASHCTSVPPAGVLTLRLERCPPRWNRAESCGGRSRVSRGGSALGSALLRLCGSGKRPDLYRGLRRGWLKIDRMMNRT